MSNPAKIRTFTNQANEVYTELSNIVAHSVVTLGIQAASWRQALISVGLKPEIESGAGIRYVFPKAPIKKEVVDFTDGTSLLELRRVKHGEAVIGKTFQERYPVSNTFGVNKLLFENLNIVEYFTNSLWAYPEQSVQIEMSNKILDMMDASIQGLATHNAHGTPTILKKVYVDISGAAATGGADKLSDELSVYQTLVTEIEKACDGATVISSEYTNNDTQTERTSEDLIFIYNKKYLNNMVAKILAPLFNGAVIMQMARVEQSVLVPEAAFYQKIEDPAKQGVYIDRYSANFGKMICFIAAYERFNLWYSYQYSGVHTNESIATETLFRIVVGGIGEVDDFYGCVILDGVKP